MKFSLRTKTVLLIVLTAAVISIACILLNSAALNQVVDDAYRSRADGVANTMAAVLDREDAAALKDAVMSIYRDTPEKVTSDDWGSDAFNAYVARYESVEQSEVFASVREQLRRIQDVNEVDCIYLATVDPENEYFIYLADGAYEDVCPPGCIDPLFEENQALLTDPTIGFPPYITDTAAYGWLVTAGTCVYDGDGNLICYAMVDISMDLIRAQQRHYTLIISTVLAVLTVLVCVAAIWAVNRAIIRPIKLLSHAVTQFNAKAEDDTELDSLHIQTRDEIQALFESCQQMTHDIRRYIENLIKTTQELSKTRSVANELNSLANRDALTGVGSKLAYDSQVAALTEEMRQGTARFGLVMVDMNGLKQLNDTWGHEKGNLAIQNTCKLIREVFAAAPVYRFGGDEFVVVMKNGSYDRIEADIERFKARAEQTTGAPWERVNAAIGYARYDNDDTVLDVFRRADHNMYEHKRAMKKQGR